MSATENKLYIGNLSYDVDEEALDNFFEANGISVQSVSIIKDKYTDRSKGFGFAEVATPEEMQKAIETLNGKEMNGRNISVSQARAREERRNFGPKRDNRGGHGGQGGRGGDRSGRPRNRY